jgi:hypothetical protein
MQELKAKPKPFQNSLRALAQFALHDTGAEGYAFFRKNPHADRLTRVDSFGATIFESEIGEGEIGESDVGAGRVAKYVIGPDAILVFAFQDEAQSVQARPRLDRIAESIEAVWQAAQNFGRYSELASEVADLEVRLMDSKIGDRVRGFQGSHGDSTALDAIAKHVEGILRPASTERVLERLSKDLEDEVEERRLTNRAKAILQSVQGMTEEQAHLHLRQISRKTRRKMKDVAIDLIEQHSERANAKTR